MKSHIRKFALIFFCISGIYSMSQSQSQYKVMINKDIDIKLFGTSTLHDWEMDSNTSHGEADFEVKTGDASELVEVKSLSFSLLVSNLKSDNRALDNNAYAALKSEEHKNIKYTLTSSTLSPEKDGYLIKSVGNLTIAGVTKEIIMDVHTIINKNNTITSKGTYHLKMTDFNVDPPSFMWGAMKTGDALTLEFIVVYEKIKGEFPIN